MRFMWKYSNRQEDCLSILKCHVLYMNIHPKWFNTHLSPEFVRWETGFRTNEAPGISLALRMRGKKL